LPIAEVPNLQPGDKVWVHPELPASQSAHYLLVVAFLRGSTNPPPENWFLKEETWDKKVANEGIHFTVPADAQQTLLFLAPETGGDFKTLRNAVRGRPGSFVRASQDLNQASLDRSRVQTYLSSVRDVSQTDPSSLEATSKLLARSLSLKVKQDCFDLPTTEQEQCLTQNSESLVMNDGHESMVSALTTGPGSDLAQQLSYAPTAGSGYYSAYVGKAAGKPAHGGVPVHPGAHLSQRGRAGSEAEQSAVVSQSEVGDCGGAARGRDGATASVARNRCEGCGLPAGAQRGAAGGGCAAGVLDQPGAQSGAPCGGQVGTRD
jgi:hypothetical protein